MIVLIVSIHLTTTNYLCGWPKYAKCGQLCRKKVKILIFDCFFDCECLNQLEIADYDSTNCSTPLDNQWLPDLWAKLFKMRRNLQKKLQNTEVEEVQSTLQFSTSVELRPGNVTLLVSQRQIWITALRILLIFGQKLDIDILRKLTEPFFRKKFRIIQNFTKNCIFCWFFDHFSKSCQNYISKTSEMVEYNVRNHSWRFQVQEKFSQIFPNS